MRDERVAGDRREELDGGIQHERLSAVQLDPQVEVADRAERAHPLLEPAWIEARSLPGACVDVAVRALQVAAPADEEDDG